MSYADLYRTTQPGVKKILESTPDAWVSDVALILEYWKTYNGIKLPPELLKQIKRDATSPETITRARRELVQRGLVTQPTEVTNRRAAHQQDMLGMFRDAK